MASCTRCGATLPPDARFCPGCAAPVAEAARPPGDERKVATVLFADLVGSTALGGSQDPERTRALLDRFYDAMAREIALAGGTVEKFAGDAVMAAFGAPAAQEDHCERALHAALSMQRRLTELFGDQLALRIGVNTGEVVVGRAREGSSFVTGDAVNVAARLEQAAAPGEVLIGERTAAAVRGAFELDEERTVEAKGKPDGVTARRLVRALSLMRPRGIRGLPSAFVGRERDVELLQATYRRVAERREPHLVTILGDAGVGKTTIVRHLWQWLGEEQPEPLRRTGRCLPYGRGITYWPLGEILKEHLGIGDSEDAASTRARLADRDILGLTLGLDVASELHPLAARDRLHEAWVEFLAGLADERPTVVLVEDLHWAEDDLLDLLERTVRDVMGPVMLIGSARPELVDRRRSWGAGTRNASLVWLEPLGEPDTERMIDELLQVPLRRSVRRQVVERAEGNPFFVEELLGALIDRRVLVRAEDAWAVHEPPEGIDVPDSVHAVVASRIDLLPPAEKAALQAGAVVGRLFWPSAVRTLIGEDADWGVLEERDFIRRRAGSTIDGDREYVIKHALTRDVAYSMLPKARRAHLHAAFADWLEEHAEGGEDATPLLAHHYAEAIRPEDADLAWGDAPEQASRLRAKAVSSARRAANLALARYEIADAVALLRRAVELEDDPQQRADIWREIGRANALGYDGEAFWTAMQESLAVSDDRAASAETYADLAYQTASKAGMWTTRPDDGLVASWIDKAIELSEPASRARAKALIASVFWSEEPSAEIAREADRLAEQVGDAELRVDALFAREMAAVARGQYEEALTWAERALEVLPGVKDPAFVAETRAAVAPDLMTLGRVPEARRLSYECDDALAPFTPHHRVHGVSGVVEFEELTGGWSAIRDASARTQAAVAANRNTPCVRNARSLLVCALAHAHLGDDAASRRLEAEAESLRMEGYPLVLSAPRIRLALVRGELDTVEQLLDDAKPQPSRMLWFTLSATAARLDALATLGDSERTELEAGPLLEQATYLQPFALRALGRVREDEQLLERSVERFTAMGLGWHAAETRTLLGGRQRA